MMALLFCLCAWAQADPGVTEDNRPEAPTASKLPDETAIDAALVVKVSDRQSATDAVVEAAQQAGGYFSELSDDHVLLRIPNERYDAVLAEATALGIVISRTFHNESLAEQLAQLRARRASRSKMLDQYFEVLAEADASSVVTVEHEISSLISEIESLHGQIRFLEHRARYASLNVQWQYRDRSAPGRSSTSSFDWLNTLNLADLFAQMRSGDKAPMLRRAPLSVAVPEGMSSYRRPHRDERAASPDEVVFRVRAVRHKPKSDLAFWQEALRLRMLEVGYHFIGESNLEIGGQPAYRLDLSAPLGEQDYHYTVVIVPMGRKVAIIEVAGEVQRYAAASAAIDAALSGGG